MNYTIDASESMKSKMSLKHILFDVIVWMSEAEVWEGIEIYLNQAILYNFFIMVTVCCYCVGEWVSGTRVWRGGRAGLYSRCT